jgi:hypothetical protein
MRRLWGVGLCCTAALLFLASKAGREAYGEEITRGQPSVRDLLRRCVRVHKSWHRLLLLQRLFFVVWVPIMRPLLDVLPDALPCMCPCMYFLTHPPTSQFTDHPFLLCCLAFAQVPILQPSPRRAAGRRKQWHLTNHSIVLRCLACTQVPILQPAPRRAAGRRKQWHLTNHSIVLRCLACTQVPILQPSARCAA